MSSMTAHTEASEVPVLSVIVPTYNEEANIAHMAHSILDVMAARPTEVIVVDDNSPDGTAKVVQELATRDPRIRLVGRQAKLGLASAVFEGSRVARGEFICVMDADLSHDPEEIPQMLDLAQRGADVVIGSRFVPGSRFVDQPLSRRIISSVLNLVARLVLRLSPKDVLSGYVLCRRQLLISMPTHYSGRGFKFLLELLATAPKLHVEEWPIRFRERRHGKSKAGLREATEFAWLCARLFGWQMRHIGRR